MTIETQTLIIGSGVAGSLMAAHYLKKGSVTMLEAGSMVPMRQRRQWLDYLMAERLPYDDCGDRDVDFEAGGKQPWRIQGGRLFARGGSTLHWGGWCPRMKPEDFELKSRLGHGMDWPFSYNDLEPYYLRAEHYLQVAGDSNASDPPRKQPYLFEAPAYTATDGIMMQAMDKLDISYGHIPIARNGAAVQGRPACMTTGTCGYCPIGARFTGDQPLDRLLAHKDFSLRLGSPVLKLLCDRKRRIHGAEFLDSATGKSHRCLAERVIICAGALETPKLLLASMNRHWPQGVGNDQDQVGRYLIANPYFYARGRAKTNPQKLAEEVHFVTLGSRHWDTPTHQAEGKFFMNRAPSPLLDGSEALLAGKAPTIPEEHVIEMQGTMQTFAHHQNRILLAGGTTRYGLPRTQIQTPVQGFSDAQGATNLGRMEAVLKAAGYTLLPGDAGKGSYPQRGDHAMCTTRMSRSEKDGVVGEDLKVHGTDNLYILSNSVFPSGTPANPTLTLVALAKRALQWHD